MIEYDYDLRPGAEREVIVELQRSQLDANSGILDENHKEITNQRAIRFILEGLGYQVVDCSMNGDLSPKANQHNSQATKEKRINPGYLADYWFAITALPPASTLIG